MSFQAIALFEDQLAKYTGAPYAVMTDCCTHAIELCLIQQKVQKCEFTPYTYLSVPQTMHKLGIEYSYLNETEQTWAGEYQFMGTRIWDSARRLESNMYRPGMMQCLSFGYSKPIDSGRGGAILLDDYEAYRELLAMRYDGRDLTISPWNEQVEFKQGYHYRPTIEEALSAGTKLSYYVDQPPKFVAYPDLRKIRIVK